MAEGGETKVSGAPPCHKSLRQMRWADVKELMSCAAAGWSRHNAPRMGAALAFYSLLSLMPLLLVAISVAGLIFGPRAAQAGVMRQLQLVVGWQRAQIVEALLTGAQNRTEGVIATVFGTLVLMFGATGVLTELRDALNGIWEAPLPTMSTIQEIIGIVKERLWSLALVVGIVILLTLSLVVGAWISALGALTSTLPGHIWLLHLFNLGTSFVAVTVVFATVYKVVPRLPVKWPDVIVGAAVTALLFTIGNFLLGLYLGKASLTSTYGAASSTVVLAMWVYYSSLIFFFGAEFTKAFAESFGSAPIRRARSRKIGPREK